MTAEEAAQHDWIKEGLVHRSRVVARNHNKRQPVPVAHHTEEEDVAAANFAKAASLRKGDAITI